MYQSIKTPILCLTLCTGVGLCTIVEYLHRFHSQLPKVEYIYADLGYSRPLYSDDLSNTA
jgi:hypothetical protein